jgi:hypothetical protein
VAGNQDHTIQKVHFQVQIKDQGAAYDLQTRLMEAFNRTVLPELDALFDEFAPAGTVIEIDRLECGLGKIEAGALDAQMPRLMVAAVREAMEKLLFASGQEAKSTFSRRSEQESKLADFVAFVTEGKQLWPQGTQGMSPSEIASQLIEQQPENFLAELRRLASDNRAIERFVLQIDVPIVLRILRALDQDLESTANLFMTRVETLAQHAAWMPQNAQRQKAWVLHWLLSNALNSKQIPQNFQWGVMSELTRHGQQSGWIKAASLQAWLNAGPGHDLRSFLWKGFQTMPANTLGGILAQRFSFKDHHLASGTAMLDEFSRAVLSGWADRLQTGPLIESEWEKLLLANFNTVLALDGKDPKGKTKGKSGIGRQAETTPAISEGQLQKEGLVQEKSQVAGLEDESGSETTLDEDTRNKALESKLPTQKTGLPEPPSEVPAPNENPLTKEGSNPPSQEAGFEDTTLVQAAETLLEDGIPLAKVQSMPPGLQAGLEDSSSVPASEFLPENELGSRVQTTGTKDGGEVESTVMDREQGLGQHPGDEQPISMEQSEAEVHTRLMEVKKLLEEIEASALAEAPLDGMGQNVAPIVLGLEPMDSTPVPAVESEGQVSQKQAIELEPAQKITR